MDADHDRPSPMPWFRFYTETTRDPKLRTIPAAQRWVWPAVECLARRSPQPGRLLISPGLPCDIAAIADEAALSIEETAAALEAFSIREMVHRDGDTWVVTNFRKRQYSSDTSTDRVRKSREKAADVKRSRNVSVAPPDSENRERERGESTPTKNPAFQALERVFEERAPNSVAKTLSARIATASAIDELVTAGVEPNSLNAMIDRAEQTWRDGQITPKAIARNMTTLTAPPPKRAASRNGQVNAFAILAKAAARLEGATT